jgi:hypothetical protein
MAPFVGNCKEAEDGWEKNVTPTKDIDPSEV